MKRPGPREALTPARVRSAPTKRQVVERSTQGDVIFQRELVRCGKPKCKRCRRGAAHGPYWYAYFWRRRRRDGLPYFSETNRPRLVSKYIGKTLDLKKLKREA